MLPPVGVSVDGLLVQIHVEVPALAGLDAVSAILCAACLVPAHLNCSWCRFLLWVWFGPWGMSSICCCFSCSFCFFLLRAADALSCGGACSAICGCCFCNSMCCLSCSCAFKLQLVPVPAFGLVRALEHEQHLLFRLLLFLLKGC